MAIPAKLLQHRVLFALKGRKSRGQENPSLRKGRSRDDIFMVAQSNHYQFFNIYIFDDWVVLYSCTHILYAC